MSIQAIYAMILCPAAIIAGMNAALAHDPEHPELSEWYAHLHNGNGGMCCDGSDAKHLSDPEWRSQDGHYEVQLEGRWIVVPDTSVVNAPNRDGRAMVWPYYLNGELIGIRCFMPGSMT